MDGNYSIYTLAGIPTLFSALRALLIESSYGVYGVGRNPDSLKDLIKSTNEVSFFAEKYMASEPLFRRLTLLNEVRNEIVHPTHTPAGTSHGTPEYLSQLRAANLLQSTNNETSDYTWIAQLQSHRLFGYTFAAIEESALLVLKRHHASEEYKCLHLQSYSRYRSVSL